ncbi:hypothetical protein [Nocardia testacea]|uniref:hypothetical protein n=1 Tax=Nocardia testacea TaxID=248551 RepID=UPI0002FE330F|nr:hypothetical protein [Nocardia testacea]
MTSIGGGEWRPAYGLGNGRTGVNPRRLYQNDAGDWEEPAPTTCRNNHPLSRGRATVGWVACRAAGRRGHRTHRCNICGYVVKTPPGDEYCTCETERGRWVEHKK